MTLEQLDLITKAIRGKQDSIAYRAAKLVLVDGLSQAEACESLSAKPQAVQNGVTRYSDWDEEIRKVYGLSKNT